MSPVLNLSFMTVGRFQGLLTADEGEQECKNLCQECSEDIKQASLAPSCIIKDGCL